MKKQTEFINYASDIEFLARRIYCLLNSFKRDIIHDARSKNKMARSIANDIYDLPVKASGFVSEKTIDAFGYRPNVNDMTAEHYYNRQEAGVEIVNEFLVTSDLFTFTKWLSYNIENKYTSVHYVSKEENIKLSKIQNDEVMKHWSWVDQYKQVPIVLVKDPGCDPDKRSSKYSCFDIKGHIFKTSAAAAEYFSVANTTIYKWMKTRDDCVGVLNNPEEDENIIDFNQKSA